MQVRLALAIGYPKTAPSFVIIAGLGVELRQVARPSVGASLLILVFVGSDVDHVPTWPTMRGQAPFEGAMTEN